jgi:hypothetical protein
MSDFHPKHLADLRKSGLTDETIQAAGIYTVTPGDIGKKLGGLGNDVVSALVFPYPDCDGYERFKVWREDGETGPKYLQKIGTPNHLYMPPAIDLAGNSPLLLTEGEKKVLSLWQAGFQVVGIGGVWNWLTKGEDEESRPIADLDLVNWKRSATITFDSDGHDNPMVRLAAFRLARELSRRGAAVSILFLPHGENREKVGADDFLVAHRHKALADLPAWSFNAAWGDHEAEVWWQMRDMTPEIPLPEKLKCLTTLIPVLTRMGHVEAELVLSDLATRLKLPAKFLSALRKDIVQSKKSKTQKKDDKEAVYTAMLPGLVDLVEHDGVPAFLMLTEDGLGITPEWEHDGVLYAPPPREQIPWLLPRGGEVLEWYSREESPGILYDDLLAYHKAISELPSEGHYHLLTTWDFHSYMLEPCQYSPEICLFAVPERGKSRTGKGMIYVSRRGVHVESLRDAYLVRLAHNFQATTFFDVMGFWKKAERAGSEDIILGRFERGIKVPRVLYPERGAHRDTVYYEIFGPTIIATNVQVHNILDTRAVQINMPQTSRRFEKDVTPDFALPLKERLTAFRAHHLGKSLPDCDKPAAGRLGDILKPLLQLFRLVKPEREPVFMELVRELERGRLIDKSDSLEAQLLLVLDSLKDQLEKGIMPVKLITDTFNESKPDNLQITYQRIGRKLTALGFIKGKTGDGASAIIWDEEKFLRILSSYGLGRTSEIPEMSETPEEAPPDAPDVSDHSDVSDVYSDVRGEKELRSFLKTGRPSPPGAVLRLWNPNQQWRVAAQVREAAAIDLRRGEL